MVAITMISRTGAARELEATEGLSLMEVLRSANDEVEALCGGSCACATCHVYVDPNYSNVLEAISDMEEELLSCSDHRISNSRLSCQITVRSNLAGMRVTVAPAD